MAGDEEAPKVYEYTGDGSAFHSGVPARDLTRADVDALDEPLRALLDNSPLYRPVGRRGGRGEPAPGPKVDDQGRSLEPASPPQGPAVDESPREGVAAPESGAPPAAQSKTGARRARR